MHVEEYKNISSNSSVLLVRGFRWDNIPEERGWIRALTEAHMLFDEVQCCSIKPEDNFSKYQAIILPDTVSIPDWMAKKLDRYAQEGGCVIASGETGKYDGEYNLNENYPLDCMGVEKIHYLRKNMASAMLHVEEEDMPLFDSFDNDRVLYFGDCFCFAEYKASVKGYLRLIPPHHLGPPERCYYTQVTDIAGVQVNAYGNGRGVLIPWMPGLLFYRDGYANTFRFMRDLLKNIAGIENVEASPFTQMVEVTAGIERKGHHALVQLVNHTGHFGTSYLAPVPVYGIALKIPCEQKPKAAISQTTGQSMTYKWEKGILYITIERLDAFEGLLIQF